MLRFELPWLRSRRRAVRARGARWPRSLRLPGPVSQCR